MSFKTQCYQCKWFNTDRDFNITKVGKCCRHPPVVLMDQHGNCKTKFPIVNESDFCGDSEKEEERHY